MRLRSILLLAGASLLWGSAWMCAPSLAAVAAPCAAAALVFAEAALALSPAFLLRAATDQVPIRTTARLALTLLAAPTALLTIAGRHGASGFLPLLYAALPLVVSLLVEGWSPSRSPAMVVAIGATYLLLHGSVPLSPNRLAFAFLLLAAVVLQAFALRYAAAQLGAVSGAALLRSLALQCAVTAAALALLSPLLDPAPRLAPLAQWTAAPAVSLALLATLATAVPYGVLLFLLGQAQLGPAQIAASQWLQFLFAFAEGAAFARLYPPPLLLGAACVLLGCFVAVVRACSDNGEALLSLCENRPHEHP